MPATPKKRAASRARRLVRDIQNLNQLMVTIVDNEKQHPTLSRIVLHHPQLENNFRNLRKDLDRYLLKAKLFEEAKHD